MSQDFSGSRLGFFPLVPGRRKRRASHGRRGATCRDLAPRRGRGAGRRGTVGGRHGCAGERRQSTRVGRARGNATLDGASRRSRAPDRCRCARRTCEGGVGRGFYEEPKPEPAAISAAPGVRHCASGSVLDCNKPSELKLENTIHTRTIRDRELTVAYGTLQRTRTPAQIKKKQQPPGKGSYVVNPGATVRA